MRHGTAPRENIRGEIVVMQPLLLEHLLVFFFFYSFVGWVSETLYKTLQTGRFMNSGFLYGPVVPIYGFCAVMTISAELYLAPHLPFAVRAVLYALLATLLEYYTGTIYEQAFGVRLWDYSGKPLNFRGRVCLQYSFYWFVLTVLCLALLHPQVVRAVATVPNAVLAIANRVLIVAILTDFLFACRNLTSVVRFFRSLNSEYLIITRDIFQKSVDSFNRLLGSFPNLRTYINTSIGSNILHDFTVNMKGILTKTIVRGSEGEVVLDAADGDEAQFTGLVADILANEKFLKLREFRHHNGSIFDHARAVAYLTYRYCRKRNLDYRSATRAALLHDFFLYDWRTGYDKEGVYHKGHIYLHPKMALRNSEEQFVLNDMERDIILNHMWPLSPSLPRYKETFVVSFIDKFISTREFFEIIRPRGTKNGS